MRDVLSRSADLLKQANKTIYFINSSTLLRPSNGIGKQNTYELNTEAFQQLMKRLEWLSATLPSPHEILFALSRLPQGAKLDTYTIENQLCERIFTSGGEEDAEEQLRMLLDHYQKRNSWTFNIVDAYRPNHINEEDGSLNVDAIVHTLVKLFHKGMVHSKEEPEFFVLQHLLQCWKSKKRARLFDSDYVPRQLRREVRTTEEEKER